MNKPDRVDFLLSMAEDGDEAASGDLILEGYRKPPPPLLALDSLFAPSGKRKEICSNFEVEA